jgi:molybdopterin-biosynthesis enzyme MoeA-like protein
LKSLEGERAVYADTQEQLERQLAAEAAADEVEGGDGGEGVTNDDAAAAAAADAEEAALHLSLDTLRKERSALHTQLRELEAESRRCGEFETAVR